MRLIKFTTESDSSPQVGVIEGEQVVPLARGPQALTAILHADDFLHKIEDLLAASPERIDLASIKVTAPIDHQEVWARGSHMNAASRHARKNRHKGELSTTRFIAHLGRNSSSKPLPAGFAGLRSRSGSAAIAAGRFQSPNLPW